MTQDEPHYREVTAEQYHEGYLDLTGAIAIQRPYQLVHETGRGTYIVREPKVAAQPDRKEAL